MCVKLVIKEMESPTNPNEYKEWEDYYTEISNLNPYDSNPNPWIVRRYQVRINRKFPEKDDFALEYYRCVIRNKTGKLFYLHFEVERQQNQG
jgi:hypothetical protein